MSTPSTAAIATEAPEGFRPMEFASPFARTVDATFYVGERDGKRLIGLFVEPQHTHARGFAHGGFLLALADFALSYGTWAPDDLPPRMTLHLNADFMRPALCGAWLEVEIDTKKTSDGLSFADCLMRSEGRIVVRASGVFRPMRPRTPHENSDQ